MHDQVQPALEIVEHRDFLAEHQQDVGRAQLVAGVAVGETRFDVLDAFESEPADQAAGETGQSIDLRHRMHRAQAFDLGRSEEPTSELQSLMRNSYAVSSL